MVPIEEPNNSETESAVRGAAAKSLRTHGLGRLADSQLVPAGLGVLSVVASLWIGYFAYQHSLARGAQRLRLFYLSKAKMLVAATEPLARHSDSELLAELQLLWDDSGPKAPDEYLCIVDNESILILHTARPETTGRFVGDNVVLSEGGVPTWRLQDLPELRDSWVGGYVSSAGQEQIAAFVSIPQRDWVLAVNRSRAAFDAEVRSEYSRLGFAFLGVCGLLLPAALVALHRIMRRLERRRQQAAVALRESFELLWAVHEANPDLQFVLDPDGTITRYHAHDDSHLYESPENFIGKKMQEMLPVKVGEQFRTAFDTATANGSLVTIDYTLPMQDGARSYEARIVSLPDQRLVVTVRDITDRRRAESELKRERDTSQMYLDIAGTLFCVLSSSGEIVLINKKGCAILGRTREELIGASWFQGCVPKRCRKEVSGFFRELMAGNGASVEYYENPVVTKDGEERLLFFHNTVLRDESFRITGVLFSAEDITERKRAEEELENHREHLEQRVRERTNEFRKTVNLMADRENRMAELKRSIKKLREQLEYAGMTPVADEPMMSGSDLDPGHGSMEAENETST